MGILDFLFEGKPPASVTTYGTSTQNLPAWYNDYTQGLIAKANAVAAEPYQAYAGPRVAGFAPDQERAFDLTRGATGAWGDAFNAAKANTSAGASPGGLTQAQNYFSQSQGFNPVNAASPWLNQAGAMSPTGAAQGFINSGQQMLQDAARSTSGVGQNYIQQGMGISPLSAAQGYFSQAAGRSADAATASTLGGAEALTSQAAGATSPTGQNLILGALGANPLSAAAPYLAQAGQTFPGAVQSYMNPYTQSVVDEIGRQAGKTWNEQIMPGVNDQFIRGGSFGNSRNAEMIGRAARDFGGEVAGQMGQALERGFTNAGQLFNQDAARMAGLASTAGGLTQAQQAAMMQGGRDVAGLEQADRSRALSAAQAMAQLASTRGSLIGQDQNLLTQIGQATGNLTAQQQQALMSGGANLAGIEQADQARALSAGQAMGQLGSTMGGLTQAQQQVLAQIGNTYGSMTADQAARAMQMGATAGNLAQGDASARLSAGQQLGALAQLQQQLGITDAAALEGVGQQQQAMWQRNLDTAYGDFQQQRQYPQDMVSFMNNIVRGLQVPTSTTASQTGPADAYQPSPLATLASAGTGLSGLLGLLKGKG